MILTLRKELNHKLHLFFTGSIAFLLPIWPEAIPVAIFLLILNWIAGGNAIRIFHKNDLTPYFLLSLSLYVLYLAGLLFTQNMQYASKDLETKFSLLILPAVYFSSEKMNKQQFRSILKAFINGCLVSALTCFAYATYRYVSTKYAIAHGSTVWDFGINYFLKDRLSVWIHPSYRAMYYVMALICIYKMRGEKENVSFVKKYFPFIILSLFILLFGSKAGIISILILGIISGSQIAAKERKIMLVITAAVISILAFSMLYSFAPQFAIRIDGAYKTLSGNVDVKKSGESTASRIAIWNASKVVISENWLSGTGTGDVKDILLNEYKKEGKEIALKENLNAHNQFLQTFVTLGILGFLSLLLMLIIPLLKAIQSKNFIFSAFIILFILNILVESMLETQAGVVFYAFFNSLFLFSIKETE